MPVTPQKPAGWRIEPPVSLPVAAGARRAATALDEPPEEPPGTRALFQGLRTGCGASNPTGATPEFSLAPPMANSSQLSLPSVTQPASASWRTMVASNGER